MFVFILTFIVIALTLLYYVSTRNHNYWDKKKVPYLKPKPILGNYGDYILLKRFVGEIAQDICRTFPNEPYVGTFYGSDPALLVQDPEILKLILTKDFYYFSSREVSQYTHNEVITQNLFFTYGDRWRVIRQNLTPIFTTAKMKLMFRLIAECCHTFEKSLDLETSVTDVIEVRALTARYTIESIGSCAFGIETNSMLQSDQNPFILMGNKILENSVIRALLWNARAMWPSIYYGVGLKTFPAEINTFFNTILTNIFKARDYKPSARNDFIDCILNLKNNKYITGDSMSSAKEGGDKKKVVLDVDDDLMVGSCVLFFTAGFETSSTTMAYTLYELAKHKEEQRRVQEEIDQYLKARENKVGYDCVNSLTYTEACVDEALRLYPVLGVLTREVVEDYTFPSGLTLEKDCRVHIPMYHLHHNPEFFPEPEAFKPERFLPENKDNIKPYTYIPFGEGPRICIGMRFAKMQTLAGLLTILKKYSVELADGTPEKLQFDPRAVVTTPIGGIPLKFTPRDGWEQRNFNK